MTCRRTLGGEFFRRDNPSRKTMGEALIRATVRKWGNTYGIRISKKDLEKLGVKEGAEVTARISTKPSPPDLSMFPVFYDAPDVGKHHDRYLAEGVARKKQV